jgi:hypothetical protein
MKKLALSFLVLLCSTFSYAEDIRFPVSLGVIDVTKPPYNADNTGYEEKQ